MISDEQITGLKKLIDELGPSLNAYLKSIGKVQVKTDSP
jgi:hypothetical protein